MPRTYACCYCNQRFNRYKLPKHMESHESEIPENLTPYQVAYDIINDHPDHHGRCTICGKITNWSTKNQKYHRICRDKRCAEAIQKTYQERMMKVYNKPHLMDDVNHLEKMLAHRKISGKYKWSDGTEFTYTGSYEKNFLEFLDKVMNYDSREIISPGPVLEYDYKGKKHKWITDVMILPYNLIVEIKDGGDNKNGNQAWKGTREKTIAKEVMITNLGKYNYIRLTNNDFAQFLGIIAELKMQIVDDTVSPLYRIHEDTSLDEGFIKDGFISVISGVQKFNRRINDLEKKNKQSYSKPQLQSKPKITERALKLKNNILQMKPSYGLNYEDCAALTSVIDSIPEDKLVNYLYKYGGYSFSELMEDRDESSDKQIKQFFKGKKLTKTLCDEGEYDLFFYCYDTKKWYQYHHEDEPCISINKAMSYSTMKQEFKKSYEIDELDEAFDVTKIFVNMVKDEFKAGITGYQNDHPVKLKFGDRLEKIISAPLLAAMGIPMGLGADVIVAIVKALSKIYDYKEAHKSITQKDIDDLGKAMDKIKKSLKDEEEKYKEIYEDVMKEKNVYLEKALPGLISIYNIPEDKMIKQLDNCSIEELFDYKDIHFKDKAFIEKYSGKKIGYLTYKYGEDGMMYCYDTKEWFIICFDVVNEPVIQSKALSYKEMYKKLQGILWSEHRDYKDELAKLEKKYKDYKSRMKQFKEDSLPEAIDNPYMLKEAQEWEHLTHMWSNAIDDIIGNVTNSPFEVAKGSYIDHDPETGKEVCVMRTIRPKAELKNREYRDRLKKQMYHLQQKINKAYNVHPSVVFIQYPIDNTNLTEGLIIGITKTSR